MTKNIGIIAPFVDEQYVADFALRLKNGGELTFKNIFTIIKNNYKTDLIQTRLPAAINESTAAGYYLSGFLRAHGYGTVLEANVDKACLNRIADSNPIAICISTSMMGSKESLKLIVDKVRSFIPEVPIIVGGIFVWKSYLWYEKYFRENTTVQDRSNEEEVYSEFLFPAKKTELDVDIFIISSNGCPTLLDVLKEIGKGHRADLEKIPNILYSHKHNNR